ncbi:MAG: DNA mismatch repair ATPase MutS, partial [Pirellulaceae bacterium]
PMHLAAAIEGWRKQRTEAIPRWLDSMGVFETLLSLAVYRYERSDDVLPEFLDASPTLTAREMGHPLLPADERICNDVQFGDSLRLMMVSGSNMSGKSTYLRTIGCNVVLAMAGAPVVAKTFQLSPLRVASSMRIQDSLQTGTSHFYAEIKRLKLIVEWAESDEAPVLFLLDEILHGTNSHDRGVGAEAVVSKLLNCGAIGLVTTHDLALTEFIVRLSQPAKNVHFADQFADGEMVFDYRCRDGIVQKSNAIELMRSLGLEV